jgi:hypothetical protein
MNKKNIIASFVLVLVIGVALYLFLNDNKKDNREYWHELKINEIVEYEPAKNYEIKREINKKRVINENISLSFEVLEDWKVDIEESDNKTEVKTRDSNFVAGVNFPKQGCEISVGAVHFLDNEQETKPKIIKKILSKEQEFKDNQEIISLNGEPVLKTIQYDNKETGGIIVVEKPFNNSLYFFKINFSQKNRVNCLDEYDKFLKLIEIK